MRLIIAIAISLTIGWSCKTNAQTNVQLEALKRLKNLDIESNPALKKVVLSILESAKGKPAFVEIIRDFKLEGFETELIRFAQSHPNKSEGVEAMRLALTVNGLALIGRAIVGNTGQTEATAIVLANTLDPKAEPILLKILKDSNKPFSTRKVSLDGLAKTKSGAMQIIKAAEEKQLDAELSFFAGNSLRNARWKSISNQANQLFPAPQGLGKQLPPLAKLIQMEGKIKNGEKVFFRSASACSTCHQINSRGIDFGPKLSGIGTKLGKEALYLSILEPNAGISFGYEAWLFKLKNGTESLGIITSKTEKEITITVPGGISTTYKTIDIESNNKLHNSIMPAGLQATMSTQELVDLVSYLHSLKEPKY